jgi:hypothetical protein
MSCPSLCDLIRVIRVRREMNGGMRGETGPKEFSNVGEGTGEQQRFLPV